MGNSRILVVEDDPTQARELKTALEFLGHTVLGPAADCSSALELIWREKPDLAYVDTHLGSETCEAVLDECDLQQVPVIITLAEADEMPPFCESRSRLGTPVTATAVETSMTFLVQSS